MVGDEEDPAGPDVLPGGLERLGNEREEAGVRLVRREVIGDMGSIVFPASHALVTWMRDQEAAGPGAWRGRSIVGR